MSADLDQEPVSEEEDAAAGVLAMALRDSGLLGGTEEAETPADAEENGSGETETTEPETAGAETAVETPAEETTAEETPAEETPAEETPAEETPAEETPAEETPAEETPAEETPAEKAEDASAEAVEETSDSETGDSETGDSETGDSETGDSETGEAEEDEEPDAPVHIKPENPYELPGDWYVIHSYSGYENKVKVNLETRISTMHMDGSVFDVVIPMEDVVEIKGGKKVTVPKKVLPGYLLVRMYMDDDAWFTVRNTPGVTGFVGNGTKPSPLTRREVERFLGTPEEEGEETKTTPRFKPAWDVGESVRVVDGPFADFNGVIDDINLDQSKVRVLVNIFDRETPVELTFEQIVKI